MTRREIARILVAVASTAPMRSEESTVPVSGVDHIKVRVANAGASAMFYYGLFGGEIVPVRNRTFPDGPDVEEVFLKIGGPRFPYLILSETRKEESPGLDHLSLLTRDLGTARTTLARNHVSLIDPGHGVWFRDADGTLIELMAVPTWGLQAQSMRLPVPSNLAGLRAAFQGAALRSVHLRAVDADRLSSFYSQLFGSERASGERSFTFGPTGLQLNSGARAQTPGLDRLVIAVRGFRPAQSRRILEERGIRPSGSQNRVILHDPDGNEVELAAA